MANTVDIIIRARDATLAVWNRVSKHAHEMGRRIGAAFGGAMNVAKQAAAAVGIFGAAVMAAGRKAVQAYQQQAAAEAKLQATLKATGYAAGITSREMVKHASELQKLTGVGDEVIISMQGMLASFDKISGENFRRATVAALDMSATLRKSGASSAEVEGAAMQLGKALQDPVGQLGMLSRVGIAFTEQQKTQIKAMVDVGNVAGAQSLILSELEGRFGGAAKAVADSTHGMAQLKAAFGDTLEEVGKAIVGVNEFDGVIAKITAGLEELQASGYIELWAEKATKAMRAVIGVAKDTKEWLGGLGIVEGIKNVAAFAGAATVTFGQRKNDSFLEKASGVSAVRALREAGAAAGESRATDDQENAKETAKRLAEIKAEKASKEDAAAAAEKADMEAARARGAVVQSDEDAEDAAKSAADAEKERAQAIEETNRLLKEKADLEREMEVGAHRDEAQAHIEDADKRMEAAKKRLDELAMSEDEKREAKKAATQEAFDDRRFRRLREKEKKGARLSRFEREALEKGKLRIDVGAAEEQKKAAEENLRRMDADEAKRQRALMVESLDEIKRKLAANLQAA